MSWNLMKLIKCDEISETILLGEENHYFAFFQTILDDKSVIV